ncbi:MAG: DNA-3-methyladenine glycosylase 2 family protein [Deltaproteobacteria bacterium]|nr:DNA-3-methyladenine glycosylase 2 family protein [Deltaproteobacteria bacterium]
MKRRTIRLEGPYDLALSLKLQSSFSAEDGADPAVFRAGLRVCGKAAMARAVQKAHGQPMVEVSTDSRHPDEAAAAVEWMLFSSLDLKPFYRAVSGHPVLGKIVKKYHGVKPLRPQTLFEMLVVAVTEQQISMAAARKIRGRVVERFGEAAGDLPVFPAPRALARASIEDLMACGLSRRKAEYIQDLAQKVENGSFDPEGLRDLDDGEVRREVESLRGFGRWSADYLLVRGLGRADVVPVDDLGVRDVVGRYLGDGKRMGAEDVKKALEPLAPFRGLAVYYLFAESRLGG